MTLAGSTSGPVVRSPDRAGRWAYGRTLRDLRLSAARRRPISLPNLLRLYRRRASSVRLEQAAVERGLERLAALYFRLQPFAGGWRS